MHEPEPSLEPPEDGEYMTPSCGHEIYAGEEVIEWIEGKRIITICGECLMDKIKGMSIQEVADHMDCRHWTV